MPRIESSEQRAKRLAGMKAWREANRERFLAAQKRWRDERREALKARSRDYRQAHKNTPECRARRALQKRKRYAADPEIFRAAARRHYEANADRINARDAEWRRRNPETVRAVKAVSDGKSRVGSGDLTARQWAEILLFYGNACARCHVSADERPLTIDHFIPVAAGGGHDWKNVWPLCLRCNQKKRSTVPPGAPPHVTILMLTAARTEASA